jgi:hypothetical protein
MTQRDYAVNRELLTHRGGGGPPKGRRAGVVTAAPVASPASDSRLSGNVHSGRDARGVPASAA